MKCNNDNYHKYGRLDGSRCRTPHVKMIHEISDTIVENKYSSLAPGHPSFTDQRRQTRTLSKISLMIRAIY